MTSLSPDPRRLLRQQLRNRRRALSRAQQWFAAKVLVKHLRSHPVFLRSQRISFYMADDGEIDPVLLMKMAEHMGKQCYLPVLHPLQPGMLWFSPYREGDSLIQNRFGLAEPAAGNKIIPSWTLDLVLMPLVGFDDQGHRLGMGGGFYDRTFAFKQNSVSRPKTPVLMGLAHHCQKVEALTCESWDIPLDYIVTDQAVVDI